MNSASESVLRVDGEVLVRTGCRADRQGQVGRFSPHEQRASVLGTTQRGEITHGNCRFAGAGGVSLGILALEAKLRDRSAARQRYTGTQRPIARLLCGGRHRRHAADARRTENFDQEPVPTAIQLHRKPAAVLFREPRSIQPHDHGLAGLNHEGDVSGFRRVQIRVGIRRGAGPASSTILDHHLRHARQNVFRVEVHEPVGGGIRFPDQTPRAICPPGERDVPGGRPDAALGPRTQRRQPALPPRRAPHVP